MKLIYQGKDGGQVNAASGSLLAAMLEADPYWALMEDGPDLPDADVPDSDVPDSDVPDSDVPDSDEPESEEPAAPVEPVKEKLNASRGRKTAG